LIASFHYPRDERFEFDRFYRGLSDRGFIIYPGKISNANLFRIGTIGRVFPADLEQLVSAIAQVLKELGVERI
jgi:2-aminoethylphosphonate-pyruvate transaminase